MAALRTTRSRRLLPSLLLRWAFSFPLWFSFIVRHCLAVCGCFSAPLRCCKVDWSLTPVSLTGKRRVDLGRLSPSSAIKPTNRISAAPCPERHVKETVCSVNREVCTTHVCKSATRRGRSHGHQQFSCIPFSVFSCEDRSEEEIGACLPVNEVGSSSSSTEDGRSS